MKKLTALMLTLLFTLSTTFALADTAWGQLKQRIATRTGPGTEYTEPGSFLAKGDVVAVHTRVYDKVNEIWWVQVEFEERGERYRAYTGSWRMNVDLTQVPQEMPLGVCRVIADADVFAGPGWDYVMWNDTVYRGTWATLLEVEAGYGHIECWNDSKGQMWRVWAPLSCLDCGDEYGWWDDTYPGDTQDDWYTGSTTEPYNPGGSLNHGNTWGSGRTGQICRVTANSGNARSGAGAEYPVVGRVDCGEWFVIMDTARAANGVMWYQVNLGGYCGWISSGLTNYGIE